MDLHRIHFLREILMPDRQGNEIPVMQFSYDNASYQYPRFQEVPYADQEKARTLYFELGGIRSPGWWTGATIVIPDRTRGEPFWASW